MYIPSGPDARPAARARGRPGTKHTRKKTQNVMKQSLKLVLYYLAYQLFFSFAVAAPAAVAALIGGGPAAADEALGRAVAEHAPLALLLSNIAVAVHLLAFGHARLRPCRLPARLAAGCVLLTLLAMTGGNILVEALRLPDWLQPAFTGLSRDPLGLAAIVLAGPLAEELLFRGAVEGELLRRCRRPGTAVALSALVFGLVHVNPAQAAYAFGIGLLLGWLRWRTGSLVPGLAAHVLNNASAALLLALASPGGDPRTTADLLGAPAALLLAAASLLAGWLLLRRLDKRLPPGAPPA